MEVSSSKQKKLSSFVEKGRGRRSQAEAVNIRRNRGLRDSVSRSQESEESCC
jgi:hypothetical protein